MTLQPGQFGQQSLGIGAGTARLYEPPRHVVEGVQRYAKERGLSYSDEGLETLQVDPQRGFAQALAYRGAMGAPEAPEAAESYKAMSGEVERQYEFMTRPEAKGGMGLTHEVSAEDPYESAQAMGHDVGTFRRIRTLATATTGPTLGLTEQQNDRFRAVHDVFGHAALGRGFTRHGEEAAYRAHVQLFPQQARSAMTSETRGQNSFLNYGPSGSFPDQGNKLVVLPQWAEETGPTPEQPVTRRRIQRPEQQQKLF